MLNEVEIHYSILSGFYIILLIKYWYSIITTTKFKCRLINSDEIRIEFAKTYKFNGKSDKFSVIIDSNAVIFHIKFHFQSIAFWILLAGLIDFFTSNHLSVFCLLGSVGTLEYTLDLSWMLRMLDEVNYLKILDHSILIILGLSGFSFEI